MNQISPAHKNRGFTLIETIIYIGLFGILISGVFVSIYPFLTGAEYITKRVATEAEATFVMWKIRWALAESVTTQSSSVSEPDPGDPAADELVISGSDTYTFDDDDGRIRLKKNSGTALPITSERIEFSDFSVTQDALSNDDLPRSVTVSFKADGTDYGPVTYYVHFPRP